MLCHEDFRLGLRAHQLGLLSAQELWDLCARLDGGGGASADGPGVAEWLLERKRILPGELERLRAGEELAAPVPSPAAPTARTEAVAPPAAAPGRPRGSDAATLVDSAAVPLPGARPGGGAPAVAPGPGSVPEPVRPPGAATLRSFGKYDLLEELGRGGMGVVYKAYERDVRRVVALKTLLPEVAQDAGRVARFYREVRLAAPLRHPAIVPILDFGDLDGIHYFTMDFISGRTLETHIAAGPIPLRQGLEWIRPIAEALELAHRAGVLHRDVKPANILIDRAGKPYLTDFGLAKEVGSSTRLTLSGTVAGTPAYMSPEQVRGEQDLDPRSDIFSLGAVLYETLARKPAFEGATLPLVFDQILTRDPVPIRRLNPRVHRDLETICEKALQKEPGQRYASAGALAEDLGRFLAGEPILARPPGLVSRARRWVGRRRAPVAAAAAVLLALGGTLGWYLFVGRHLQSLEDRRRRADIALVSARQQRGEARLAQLDVALGEDPGRFEGWLLRSRARWELGLMVEALEDADRAVSLRPGEPAARLERARLLRFGFCHPAAAREDLETAARAEAGTALQHTVQGYLRWLDDLPDAGVQEFQEALRLDPNHAAARIGKAWCHLVRGEWAEARKLCKEAFDVDSADPEARLLGVEIDLATCHYAEAAAGAAECLERWPTLLEAGLALAEARALLDRPGAALREYDRIEAGAVLLANQVGLVRRERPLPWDPAPLRARLDRERARVFLLSDRPGDARPLVERLEHAGRPDPMLGALLARADGDATREGASLQAASAGGSGAAWGEWGAWLLRAGRTAEAEAAFERALAASAAPALPGRYLALADAPVAAVLPSPADADEAGINALRQRCLDRALHLDPRFAPALVRLARFRILVPDLAGARRDLDEAVARNPRCAAAWLARGCFLRDHRDVRDLDRSEADLEQALRIDPGSADVRLESGLVALRRKRPDAALAAADSVLAARPDWARARKLRADALTRLDRTDEAQAAMTAWQSCPADGEAASAAYNIGQIYRHIGKRDAAIEFFTRCIENDPRKASGYAARGDLYLRSTNLAEGLRDRFQAVRLDPIEDIELLAVAADVKKQPAFVLMVRNALTDAARRYPRDPCARFGEGFGNLAFGQAAIAYEQLRQVTEIDPGFASAYTFLALAALRCGKTAEAEQALAHGGPQAASNRLVPLIRACLRMGAGDLEDAGREVSAARKLGPFGRGVLSELSELKPLWADPRFQSLRDE